jgi:hypothetical protein
VQVHKTDPITHQAKIVTHRAMFVDIEPSIRVPAEDDIRVVRDVDDVSHVNCIADRPMHLKADDHTIIRSGLTTFPKRVANLVKRCLDCDARCEVVPVGPYLYPTCSYVVRKLQRAFRSLDVCTDN